MLLARCPRQCRPSLASQIHSTSSNHAISLKTPPPLSKGAKERVFKDKKAFQYSWYSRILDSSKTSPLLILHHNDFTAERLKKLRSDIIVATQRVRPSPVALPTLTSVRSSIFGVALRNFDVDQPALAQMISNQSGNFAVLSIPSLDPPLLSAVLRAMDRSVPVKPPKTNEQIQQEEAAKTADPDQPGRRMKRVRQVRVPELKLMGAIIEGRVFLPPGLNEVSKMPSLDTLRAQIVGLLSAPSAQIAGILGQASGGQLARTLEGLKKGLEEAEVAPPS